MPTENLSQDQQAEADRLCGQYDTLRDRAVAADYSNRYSGDEVAEMRLEMESIAERFFEITGERLR